MEIQGLDTDAGAARAFGVPRTTLQSVLKNDAIGPKTAGNIAEVLGISYKWLRTGEGPIERKQTEILGRTGLAREEAGEKVSELPSSEVAALISLILVPKTMVKLSVGGSLIRHETELPERYAFRREWLEGVASSQNNVIMMDVEGDSMSPSLNHGDTVLIDIGRTDIGQGGIFAIAVGDVIQIKKLELMPRGKVHVISDNETYADYTADLEDIRVIGKQIWFGRTSV